MSARFPARVFAVVFDGAGKPFRRCELSVPELRDGEVLVALTSATICGSDLHTILGKRVEPTPSILGHEGIGKVIATRRCGIAAGQRVTWSIADSCGRCLPCTELAVPQKCKSLFKYGHATLSDGTGLNGTYATHILLRPGTHVVPVPDSVPDRLAAPANCAFSTVFAALDAEDGGMPAHGPRKSALVQGAGLLGLFAVAVLKHALGFETVFCSDIDEKRLQLVPALGGIPLPANSDERIPAILRTCPNGVDLVIEVAGDSCLLKEGVRVLRFGGHYALVGMVHPDTKLDSIKGEDIIRRCISLRGTHNYAPKHLDRAVAFLPRFASLVPLDKLVSPPLPLSAFEKALELAKSRAYPRVSISFEMSQNSLKSSL